jgi:hypothetical protein
VKSSKSLILKQPKVLKSLQMTMKEESSLVARTRRTKRKMRSCSERDSVMVISTSSTITCAVQIVELAKT